MKKILVLCLIIGITFASMGASCIQKAQGVLCNPTPSQQQAAAAGVTIADSILAVLMVVPQTSAIASLVTSLGGAKAIFSTIQSGGCVLTTQLAEALGAIDQGQAAKAMALTYKAAPAGPDPLQPLRDWIR